MKQQEVLRKTGDILKELNDHFEDLKNTAGDIHDLELELFISNAHFLINHAEILRKLNQQKAQLQHTLPQHVEEKKLELPKPADLRPEPVKPEPLQPILQEVKKLSTDEPKYFEPLVHQARPVVERSPFKQDMPVEQKPIRIEIAPVEEEQATPQINLGSGADKDSYSFERQEPEVIKHDLILDGADNRDEGVPLTVLTHEKLSPKTNAVTMENILDSEVGNADDETREPNVIPTNPEPVIDNTPKVKEEEFVRVPDPIKETKPLSFNERMSAQLKGNHAAANTEPAEPPIKDIKAAISLNDKLLYVKDLFNGYSLAYSEAIEIVNRFTSFEEADRFLKTNYVTKNNWEGKKATMDKFYALLKRRYA